MDDYFLLNIILMVLAVLMFFISLVLIYCQKFSLKVNIGLLLTPICYMILLLIFYTSQFKAYSNFFAFYFLSLFALLVFILICGVPMIYCQRAQNETNIDAENQRSVSNILLQNSKGTVYI